MPHITIPELLVRNKTYVGPGHIPSPYTAEQKEDSAHTIVISCFDPWAFPEQFFLIPPISREIVSIRNAGGRTRHIVHDIVSLDNLLHIRDILVIHHKDCGLTHTTQEKIQTKLREYVEPKDGVADFEKFDFGCMTDRTLVETCREDVQLLKDHPWIRKDINVVGFFFDIKSGLVSQPHPHQYACPRCVTSTSSLDRNRDHVSKGLVLVTGASRFLATHILAQFLRNGYQVRGTVRNKESKAKVRKNFPEYSESELTFTYIPDVAAKGAFEKAVVGIDGVVHAASPVFYGASTFDEKLLEPAVLGTKELLESIKAHGPDVKQVVITASLSCVIDSKKGLNPGHTFTEKDWNPVDIALAKENPALMYTLSKTLAEKAAWAWYDGKSPRFRLSTICPPMIYGPVSSSASLNTLNQSTADVWNLMSGDAGAIPPTRMPAFVDVRNVATAHLRAYEHPTWGRFIPSGGKYLFTDMCEILRNNFPNCENRIPNASLEGMLIDTYIVDNSWTKRELGMSFRTLEQCIVDMGRSLEALGAQE